MKRRMYAAIAAIFILCAPLLIQYIFDYTERYQSEVLRFRGLTYEIVASSGTTIYTSGAGVIKMEELENGKSVFFQYKSYSDIIFYVSEWDGITTVYDAEGEPLLCGVWQDDTLYDADMQINDAYQTLRAQVENTRPEIGITEIEALRIASGVLITTRGRGYIFKIIPLALVVLIFLFIDVKSRKQMGELRSKHLWREKTQNPAVQWLEEVDETGKSVYSGSVLESPLLYAAAFLFIILLVLSIDIA